MPQFIVTLHPKGGGLRKGDVVTGKIFKSMTGVTRYLAKLRAHDPMIGRCFEVTPSDNGPMGMPRYELVSEEIPVDIGAPFLHGSNTRSRCKPLESNPHPEGTPAHKEWADGWHDANHDIPDGPEP